MGRTRENKGEVINDLKEKLKETQLALVIDFQGLSVAEISDLRNRLRPTGTECKVTKNTFMEKAIKDDQNWEAMSKFLKGSSAILLVKDDMGAAIKAYQAFQKESKKTDLRGGVMQGQALDPTQVKAITDLPTKDELIAQIAGALNALATKIAVGVKEIPTSIARGVQAIADQKQESN